MKKIFSAFLTFIPLIGSAQEIYTTKSTNIEFYSFAEIEDIKAVNTSSASLINTSTREISIEIPNNAFIFRNKKMELDFNENFMESEKYTRSVFNGKISGNFDLKKDGTYKATAKGKLNIHGVEKERTLEGNVTIKKSEIEVNTKFYVAMKDHNIKIPSVVGHHIADSVLVTVKMSYVPKK